MYTIRRSIELFTYFKVLALINLLFHSATSTFCLSLVQHNYLDPGQSLFRKLSPEARLPMQVFGCLICDILETFGQA